MKLLLALALSLVTLDSNFYVDACTKDRVMMSVRLVVDEDAIEVHPPLLDHLKKGFVSTAAKMNAEDLMSPEGFKAFVSSLDATDQASLIDVYQPRVVDGASCKAAN
jgi:hypothetical protein